MKVKKIYIRVLSFLVIIGFLSIQIAYNSTPPTRIWSFETVILDASNWNCGNLNLADYPSHFFVLAVEIFIVILLFIIATFVNQGRFQLYTSILLFLIWFKNLLVFWGAIEVNIYPKSSLFFLASIMTLIIIRHTSQRRQNKFR